MKMEMIAHGIQNYLVQSGKKKMSAPHPTGIEDGPLNDLINAVKQLFSREIAFIRKVKHKYLEIRDGGATVIDYEELPEERKQDYRSGEKDEQYSRSSSRAAKRSRFDTYRTDSANQIADRASDNPYILQDVIDNPSLVDASSDSEAVAKVASENPGWAKISDAVEAFDVDVEEASTETESSSNIKTGDDHTIETKSEKYSMESTSTEGSNSSGESTSLAESASDSASFNGDVSIADSGDLGPTGASGYGLDASGSSTSSSGFGGNTGGGDVGGGEL